MLAFKELGKYGRIGNILFEAAATIGLAIRNNDTYIFPHFQEDEAFNLQGCFSDNIITSCDYIEPHFSYKQISYQPNMNLHGYFQSEKYFDDCPDLINHLLSPKHPISYIANSVSLHVRRTDYLKLGKCFEILDLNYYNQALKEINAKKILVFSDDINWCKMNFSGDKFIFMENNSPTTDLALQSRCEHNIIANSSFSWWGAWLNKNPNKIVIAPKKWFGPELLLTHNTSDLIPAKWIKI